MREEAATREVNGVTLAFEHFGDPSGPLVLCVGGPTMLTWSDALCHALARLGRHVVRYDLRDSGASTTLDPEAPGYTLRDLASDAAALAVELDDRPAHLAGVGVGGMVAQVAAIDHPSTFSALTLVSTRPVAPGPVDADLPDHDAATMDRLFSCPTPDWSDRDAVSAFAAESAETLGDDPDAARSVAGRIWDRTPTMEPEVHAANQMGMTFSRIDCAPRWRERLRETWCRHWSCTVVTIPSFRSATARPSPGRSPAPGSSCWRGRRRSCRIRTQPRSPRLWRTSEGGS